MASKINVCQTCLVVLYYQPHDVCEVLLLSDFENQVILSKKKPLGFHDFCQIWQSLYRRNTCLGAFANVNSREKFQF